MPRSLLYDLSKVDLSEVAVTREKIREYNPQRYEMEQLDGIILLDIEERVAVGFKDVRDDEFWVRGHIPGRPLMPGVIMLEAAAQLCTYYFKASVAGGEDRFVGFGGVDKVKFRGTVTPGDRLVLIAKNIDMRTRRAVFDTQGVVEDKLVFEAQIIGMPV